MGKITYSIVVFCSCFSFVWGWSNSLNQVSLDSAVSSSSNYSFCISGHFYGNSSNSTGYPANSVLGNLDLLNQQAFVITLGDLFRDIKNDIPFYRKSFLSKLKVPIYNAVGNHDLSGNVYQENFGRTFYKFSTNGITHIVLDTELGDSKIDGIQLDSLQTWVQWHNSSSNRFLFIYSHRPIWAEDIDELGRLFWDNTRGAFGSNFKEEVYPLLEGKQNVYWFSGSLGSLPGSFFYYEYKGLKLCQTALRGIQRDAILQVSYKNEKVSFETVSLTGQDLNRFEEYNLDFYQEYQKPVVEFNYRLIPLLVKSALLHRYFWYGFASFGLVILAIVIIRRRFDSKA
jgi:hypothetical protein